MHQYRDIQHFHQQALDVLKTPEQPVNFPPFLVDILCFMPTLALTYGRCKQYQWGHPHENGVFANATANADSCSCACLHVPCGLCHVAAGALNTESFPANLI
jgi:hypothetical protein